MNVAKERFSRQAIVLGMKGQERLAKGSAVIVGCGATGSVAAGLLARAGIGRLRLLDRDFVEESNLHREVLYADKDMGLPKAAAAERHLSRIKSGTGLDSASDDLNPNTTDLLEGFDVILDCTDNMETRHLINEFCVKNGVPWVYGAAIRTEGMSSTFLPGGACFRCLYRKDAPPGVLDTCETSGIIAPASSIVGSWESLECIKLLTGFGKPNAGKLMHFSLDSGFAFSGIRKNKDCMACARKRFRMLEKRLGAYTACMCGRNAYSISPPRDAQVDLSLLGKRLSGNGNIRVRLLDSILHLSYRGCSVSIFQDGRAIIKNAKNQAEARKIYGNLMGT